VLRSQSYIIFLPGTGAASKCIQFLSFYWIKTRKGDEVGEGAASIFLLGTGTGAAQK
jgi:hypothetical protein